LRGGRFSCTLTEAYFIETLGFGWRVSEGFSVAGSASLYLLIKVERFDE
jgi:hypothetical protein